MPCHGAGQTPTSQTGPKQGMAAPQRRIRSPLLQFIWNVLHEEGVASEPGLTIMLAEFHRLENLEKDNAELQSELERAQTHKGVYIDLLETNKELREKITHLETQRKKLLDINGKQNDALKRTKANDLAQRCEDLLDQFGGFQHEIKVLKNTVRQLQDSLKESKTEKETLRADAKNNDQRLRADIDNLEHIKATLSRQVTGLTEQLRVADQEKLLAQEKATATQFIRDHFKRLGVKDDGIAAFLKDNQAKVQALTQELAQARAEIKNSQTKIKHLQTENQGLQTCCFDLIRVYTFWHKERAAEDTESVSDDDNDPHLVMDW